MIGAVNNVANVTRFVAPDSFLQSGHSVSSSLVAAQALSLIWLIVLYTRSLI